jgi:hypothetical protein
MAGLKRCLSTLALLSLVMGPELLATEQPLAVVLSSTAPGFAMGQVLTATDIAVPDGASTIFLLPSGQLIRVKGPYSGALTNQEKVTREQGLAQLLAPGQDRSQIGGSRSIELGSALDRFELDPAQDGIFCIMPHTEVMLARPTDPRFDRITMRSAATGTVVRLDWANAANQLAWPAGLPLEPGVVQVSSDRTGAKHRLEFRAWPVFGLGDAARAAGLALAGCLPQATAALDRLRDAAAQLDLYLDSSHGRYPTYRAGEEVEFVLQANRDAYIYCLLRGRDGRFSPLFPSQPSQAWTIGHRTLNLPGHSLPTGLRARTELDGSEIRCIASERDLATELPLLAGASGVAPLPENTVTALDRAIADSSHGRVVTAQLILRVEE